jgi:hypothetical protein
MMFTFSETASRHSPESEQKVVTKTLSYDACMTNRSMVLCGGGREQNCTRMCNLGCFTRINNFDPKAVGYADTYNYTISFILNSMKPVFRMGSSREEGTDPDDWKPMPTVGAGVREIRVRESSGAFRCIYLATRPEGIYG